MLRRLGCSRPLHASLRRSLCLLSPAQQRLRTRQRQCLRELEKTFVRIDAAAEDQKVLRDSITTLDSLFLVCVVGEFNSGKSALINALLGLRAEGGDGGALREGVLPTTDAICLIKHPTVAYDPEEGAGVDVLEHPGLAQLGWLREVQLVDTPGMNSLQGAHSALTQSFLPRADLVVHVTSAQQPLSRSDATFLAEVSRWGKPVLCAVNKSDTNRYIMTSLCR